MGMRKKLIGNMLVDIMVGTGRIEMTQSEMTTSLVAQIGEVIDTDTILVMVLTGTMIVIIIILIGGVARDICWMSLRKLSHLPLMDI